MKKFYMLFLEGNGNTPPTKKHTTLDLAVKEAKRLVMNNPKASVYLLEAVQVFKTQIPPVISEKLEDLGPESLYPDGCNCPPDGDGCICKPEWFSP